MPDPIQHRVFVLVLQHPQEQRHALSTATALCISLARARLAIGLSWRSLSGALGAPAEPRYWAVLHLGSVRPEPAAPARREITVLDRRGAALADPAPILRGLTGLVLLDGTWSQAKTLWWRNPWLLKLHRLVLDPPHPSRLGRFRREPRREALSTIEAAALALRHLEPRPDAADALDAALDALIAAATVPRAAY